MELLPANKWVKHMIQIAKHLIVTLLRREEREERRERREERGERREERREKREEKREKREERR